MKTSTLLKLAFPTGTSFHPLLKTETCLIYRKGVGQKASPAWHNSSWKDRDFSALLSSETVKMIYPRKHRPKGVFLAPLDSWIAGGAWLRSPTLRRDNYSCRVAEALPVSHHSFTDRVFPPLFPQLSTEKTNVLRSWQFLFSLHIPPKYEHYVVYSSVNDSWLSNHKYTCI